MLAKPRYGTEVSHALVSGANASTLSTGIGDPDQAALKQHNVY